MRKHVIPRSIIAMVTAGGMLVFGVILLNDNTSNMKTNVIPNEVQPRQLTPQIHIDQKWPSLADTRFKPDGTIGMDEHLISCWNTDRVANLHEHDLNRRAAYNQHFQSENDWNWGLTDGPLPELNTISGDKMGLIYSDGGSAYTTMMLWNETFAYTKHSQPFCLTCEEPPTIRPPPTRVLKGNFVAFNAWQWGHYGHSTHDVLPWFAYLKEMTSLGSTRYILLDKGYMKEILAVLDINFFHHQVIWVKYDELIEIHGSVTTLKNIGHRNNNVRFMDFLRLWSMKARDRSSARNKVIYYDRRNPKQTTQQRFVRPDIEEAMLERIKQAMLRYGKTEELVIFNGLKPNGKPMTAYDQFLLFKDATTIIGPHGSGLSGNMLWTNPMPRNCSDRVKILEFVSDKETARYTSPNRAHPDVGIITHWFWVIGWPFDYHHMLYSTGSKRDALIIDLDVFSEALDSMWGRSVNA